MKSTSAATLRPVRRATASCDASTDPPSACSGVTVSTRRDPAHAAAQVVSATIDGGDQQIRAHQVERHVAESQHPAREPHSAGGDRRPADEPEEARRSRRRRGPGARSRSAAIAPTPR